MGMDYLLKNVRKLVVHYTAGDFRQRANATYLAGCFAIAMLHMEPSAVWKLLTSYDMTYVPFRDASLHYTIGMMNPTITIYDCLCGLQKAIDYHFFDFKDFDYEHYKYFMVEGYSELNWIVPDKLVALTNPSENPRSLVFIGSLVKYFNKLNIGTVVRLNYATYNSSSFTLHGIRHVDLYFEDGTVPSDTIVNVFLRIVEESTSAVAVHCKAGLGRTGCLIGAYLMKHYRMTSLEAIAWMRICRPAMIIGSQQEWMRKNQAAFWRAGDAWRKEKYHSKDAIVIHKKGIYAKGQDYKIPTEAKSRRMDPERRRPSSVQQANATTEVKHRPLSQDTQRPGRATRLQEANSKEMSQKKRPPSSVQIANATTEVKHRPLSQDTQRPGRAIRSQGDYLEEIKEIKRKDNSYKTKSAFTYRGHNY